MVGQTSLHADYARICNCEIFCVRGGGEGGGVVRRELSTFVGMDNIISNKNCISYCVYLLN